ncbi:MAG: glycosyltransferase family 9 protein [Candidatus Aenigmarchaeota archaeon]|nr:glycosyltransferase family 9 protein [Candidatus Aenigmarchaeota archaeon]
MGYSSGKVAVDCIFFRGDVPCKPHKEKGAKCKCEFYIKRGKRILIIKLGAMGDVLRSTPITERLRKLYPGCEVTWISNYPDLARKAADIVMGFNERTVVTLMADEFDILYNFDKDKEACALASLVKAKMKKGFVLQDGKCAPADKDAEHKFVTGVFDDESKKNTKTYQEEMFEIAGLDYEGEKYAMESEEFNGNIPQGKLIGLNTGGAERWTARLWPESQWQQLALLLKKKGYIPLLLGGEAEDQKNKRIAATTGAVYLGYFSFSQFAGLVKKCEAVVTCVTLGFHVAVGMERKIILLNNIFNKHEFDLYGKGVIIEPPKACACFYKSECVYGRSCMNDITAETVAAAVEKLGA